MKVSKIGEFGLIQKLAGQVAAATDKRWKSWRQLIVGIGDDAAVWHPRSPFQIITVDSLVEGVHFSLKTTTWQELGWKAIAVNLSDIAAMGGIPLYALISLGLPPDTKVEDIQALYDGMIAVTEKFGVAIVGGDTVGSPIVFISVTVVGCASNATGKVLTRSAAQPGDKIAVTNTLGASAAGLAMLTRNLKFPPEATTELRRAHLQPYPRVTEGQKLVAHGVKAGMDISDGLVGDLTHICEMSRLGARLNIYLVPVSPVAKACFGDKALEFALNGGEDYELLFTAPARVIQRVKKALDCPVTVIGKITAKNPGKVMLIDKAGSPITLKKTGWDAFKK
ncbi:MAG: thiamine-phosphate kinase [Dehalococcoidales bacterium]|nr:thiamine-phosphate kinase [Dehalococcoidales bacterium]